jgi:hypothetical protein
MEYINKFSFIEGGFLSLAYTPLVGLSFLALMVSESVSTEAHIPLIADHYDVSLNATD